MGLAGYLHRSPPGVLIGIHVTAGSQDVGGTLRALYETTPHPFDFALLVDPSSLEAAGVAARLAGLPRVPQWRIGAPAGGAASFNRLVAENAELYVFLEAGAYPGPGWLALMLDTLDSDPAHGLAGPTTNWCWNEQSDHLSCGRTARDVARHAKALKAKHGRAWRSMAPLYSLSDFCLVVRRSVVDAIGGADEAYGRGPCWEMDYGVRAARAGFASIWAKSAFVLRAPRTSARQSAEAALLETNKRLYQDRFCGRRIGAVAAPYHSHCRGEACANFAPVAATRVRRPLVKQRTVVQRRPIDLPLISCVMPTRGRPRFVAQSVVYFHRQDYPNRELVIVYEDPADLPGEVTTAGVRLVRTAGASSIGAKRQAGTEAAGGEIIAHWDDDDWYAPARLSCQAAPILHGVADITGLNDVMFLLIKARQFWTVTPELFERMFVGNISGGTLTYRRDIWRRSGPYPTTSLREDCDFMVKAIRDGARLCPLPGRNVCIYVRHGDNTWKFAEGCFLVEADWSLAPEPDFLGPDRNFYFGEPAHEPPPRPRATPSRPECPLVSCIMPTANRRAFVAHAIEQFLAQDYARRELIVVDDGEDNVADLLPRHDMVRYLRLDRRMVIGAKRNIACELAQGEVIAHWDDDDWMAPQWLGSQVETLLREGADICGLDKVLFYALETRQGWRYVYDGRQPWVYGGTLCYTKAYWARAPFSRIDVGEDNAFVWSPEPKRMAINVRDDLYVATIHRRNTSPKNTGGHRWHELRTSQLEALLRVGGLSVAPLCVV
jgi:glycosyltransferase involved in cell wall biosynthesis